MLIKKEKSPKLGIWLILFGLVFICFSINIFKSSNLNAPGIFASDYGNKLDISFNIFENGQFIENSNLPYFFSSSTKDKSIELITTLPSEKFIDKSFIAFRVSGYSVSVEVANNEIYSFYSETTKDYGGGYWHFIKLPDNSSTKQLKIKLYCPTNNPFAHNIYPIYIGSKGYLLEQAFGSSFNSLFFGIILISFGFLFLGNIIFFNRSISNTFLLSLSLLLICLGSWVLFQSISRQVIGLTNPALPMEISFFAMCSLPFCIWFYVNSNYKNIGDYNFLKYFAFAILFLYILIFIISFFGIPYTTFLALIGGLILIYIILVLIVSIKLYSKGEKNLFSCILAIFSILISVVVEEIFLLLNIHINNVSILHAGLALAATIFIYQSIGNLIERNTEENEAILLKKLAYIDFVTLVENRNSYERFIEEEAQELDHFGIILADINGLKIINDMFGHKSGDDLLKRLSKNLKEALPVGSRLFRIGGDEFLGIIPSHSKEELFEFVEELQKNFIPTEKDCGMAIGSHFYLKTSKKSLSKTIEKTDKNMYKQKEMQKHLIHKNFIENGFSRESALMR
ncbi:MAG: GGDEF domain-containing protein [Spirochaetaceae bacterium]|nr:GGDEF domain-containing protein [Spirochaetaceae bacterium]